MENFQTDQGKEWYNTHVGKLMTKYKINHYSTFSEKKASIVERLNRTLKSKMFKEFTYKWLDLLKEIVKEYNNTVHSSIKMKPNEVRKKHEKLLLDRLNPSFPSSPPPKFKVDDEVRISKYKKTFDKAYLPSWTNETFKIYAVFPSSPVTYILQDSKGEVLKGRFYEQEISKSSVGNVFLIEKVLRRKGNKLFVKWLGFDRKHNSWIDKKKLV